MGYQIVLRDCENFGLYLMDTFDQSGFHLGINSMAREKIQT